MATKAEVEQAIRDAVKSGDTKLARSLADVYESMPDNLPQQQQQQQPPGVLGKAKNAVYGMAHSGNRAITALNPLAGQEDYDRLQREQNWVNESPGAGVGEFVGDVINYAPSGMPQGAIPRAIASGLLASSFTPGGVQERGDAFSYGTLGGFVGEKAGNMLGKAVQPFKKSATGYWDDLVRKAQDQGLTLSADQVTDNRTLRKIANVLDTLPIASSMRKTFKDQQRSDWQKALFRRGGEDATEATPQVMGRMKDRISGVYKELTDKYDLIVDDKLKADLDLIESKYLQHFDPNQKQIVKSYFKAFSQPPVNARIKGQEYQSIRSVLDKQVKKFERTGEVDTADALRGVRESVDAAMERSVTKPGKLMSGGDIPNTSGAEDVARWKKANNDWMIMRSIEDAINTGDAIAQGKINPNAFIRNMKKRNSNAMIYGKGSQELPDIARVGQAFIPEKEVGSDTAQKQMLTKLISGDFLAGAGTGILTQDPMAAITAATAAAVPTLTLPPLLTRSLHKQGGYLTKGLADMSKEALPGLTRQQLLSEALRNIGNRTALELTPNQGN